MPGRLANFRSRVLILARDFGRRLSTPQSESNEGPEATEASTSAAARMWRLSALDSVASERRPRPPTRPVHPAGRASTGTALRSMPTATAAALRSPTRSSHHARGPSSSSSRNLSSLRFWLILSVSSGGLRSLGGLVCLLPVAGAPIDAHNQQFWVGT